MRVNSLRQFDSSTGKQLFVLVLSDSDTGRLAFGNPLLYGCSCHGILSDGIRQYQKRLPGEFCEVLNSNYLQNCGCIVPISDRFNGVVRYISFTHISLKVSK